MSRNEKAGAACATRPTAPEVFLRSGVESDLSAVLEIEQASFPAPWRRASFLQELHSPYSRLLVAEQQDRVIGYLCRWLVVDEVHILNVAVHPDHRRRGIGRLLLLTTLAEARQGGARSASLEVRRSNLPAIALYQGLGFHKVAVRQRYYENGEDALLVVCALDALTEG